ncbi:MAG: hypothetical protein K8J08_21130, partial [Thermoanaerobaculia bacterium]|nr:hypothetical protein [Thermoanaerobaculia bacterium]
MSDPLRYSVTFPSPETHYVEIEASIPTDDQPQIELMLPVWTPGSYKIRDYSQHIEDLRAESTGGNRLEVTKTAKNRWTLPTWGARRVTVSYRVYGHELSVRTNYVDPEFCLLNGAATFLTLANGVARGHEVDIVLRSEWSEVVTFLEPQRAGGPNRFLAPDYDTLVDSPIYVGNPTINRFEIGGIPHTLVDQGGQELWDGGKAVNDLARITRVECELFGSIPYRSYTFLNLITGSRGGLEHAEGSVLMCDPFTPRTRKGYLQWLSLASHELFHAWNVKRLRPRELGPFDYERENTTRSLWVVEGITSYYDDLLVHRAGLSSRREYLQAFSENIKRLQATPGRRVRSLEEASFDAWLKLYQPNANTDNSSISYYVKGAVVSFLLDAKIRAATGDRHSLDDVLRVAFRQHSGAIGFTGAEFEALASEISRSDLSNFFDYTLRGTGELPYLEALDYYGLQLVADDSAPSDRSRESKTKGWLGAEVKPTEGRFIVTKVPRDTPAFQYGLSPEDEIIAIDGYRLPPEGLDPRLEA